MINKVIQVFRRESFEYFILSIILIGAFLVRLYKIDSPVADWHSWRQADTASVTRIYLEKGIDLLRPRYHDISVIQTGYFNPEGYRFVEFPIFNFVHVLLAQGFPRLSLEVWGRLVSVFSSLITLYVLFLLGKKALGSLGGLLAAFFYAFLPFNIYFTRVILPDPLATTLALAAVYLFWEYFEKKYPWQIISSSLLFGLAMLVKPQVFFYGLPILFLAIKKQGLKGILKDRLLLLSLDIALVPFFLWRAWMNNPEFLRGIPYLQWAFNKIEGKSIRFRPAFWRWLFGERIGRLILGDWGIFTFVLGLIYKSKDWLVAIFFAGSFLYFSILAAANVKHDYYQILIMPSICLCLAAGVLFVLKKVKQSQPLALGILFFSLMMMFGMSWYLIRGNYNINHPEIVEAGKKTDELLPKDTLVIAPYNGDTAFLYQTKRSGWPIVHPSIDKLIEQGATHLVSVNFDDNTNAYMNRFGVVFKDSDFVILDLTKEAQR